MKKILMIGLMSVILVACKSTENKEEFNAQQNYEECLRQETRVAKSLKNTDKQARTHALKACRRVKPGTNYK